jgi:hypothetical protein
MNDQLEKRITDLENIVSKDNFSSTQTFIKSSEFKNGLRIPYYDTLPPKCAEGQVIDHAGVFKMCTPTDSWETIGTGKFGGTGADGALSVTSGTTTIDLASAEYLEKNYSSIFIGIGATLTFSNPPDTGSIINLKTSGDCYIAGTITAQCGSAGGPGGVPNAGGGTNGTSGADPSERIIDITDAQNRAYFGVGANKHSGGSGGAGGAGGSSVQQAENFYTISSGTLYRRLLRLIPGAGGGGGASGNDNTTGGAGGRGGGALLIECAGQLDFDGSIDVSGADGGPYNVAVSSSSGTGGGGGGGGGMLVLLANTIGANSGTVDKTGGNGSAGENQTSGANGGDGGGGGGTGVAGAGGAGGAGGAPNSAGVTGTTGGGTGGGTGGTGGTSDGSSSGGGGGGGGGGAGTSVIATNTYFG